MNAQDEGLPGEEHMDRERLCVCETSPERQYQTASPRMPLAYLECPWFHLPNTNHTRKHDSQNIYRVTS